MIALRRILATLASLLVLSACTKAAPPSKSASVGREEILSIIALNDLHGQVEALPVFAGYVANLRRARKADRGGVLVLDAGDMFQGTLACNLDEGQSLFRAYRALGVSAVALGNHEFDFGPLGAGPSPPDADPEGAIKARIQEATFPVLSANLVDRATGRPVTWPKLAPSVLLYEGGVKIGIVGGVTDEAGRIIKPEYFKGLAVAPLASSVEREARLLRKAGAEVVVALVHAGAECHRFDDPRDLSSCDGGEALTLARRLPTGLVNVIVGGHTHAGVAHFENGVAVVEAYLSGRAFSRVDLRFDRVARRVISTSIQPPHPLCPTLDANHCVLGNYEGAPVRPDPAVRQAIASQVKAAEARSNTPLGVRIDRTLPREHQSESALGNLFADLMLEASPGADLALANGGSLRADLPSGMLTYGRLFEAMPFDNRLVVIELRAETLMHALAVHFASRLHGLVSVAGVRVIARCRAGALEVSLLRRDGTPIAPGEVLRMATSDYIASGGDRFLDPGAVSNESDAASAPFVRDILAQGLSRRAPALKPSELEVSKAHPRLDLPTPRPVSCGPLR